jgi:hypothetical protein
VARFCLDNRLLGTAEHLVVADGTFWWAKTVPTETWHLDGMCKDDSDWCLDTVLRLAGSTPSVVPPEPFVREMSTFSGSLEGVTVPWQKVMPAKAHQGFIKRLVGETVLAMEHAPLDYYRTVWVPGNGIFRALKPCSVDRSGWEALVKAGEGNVPAIRSFEPNDDGFADPVAYDRFKTLTGRLTVHAGPQILTLKREHRKILRSAYGEHGGIYSLDFAALEARILLYEYGRKCDELDLYGMIAKELGYDRKAIKGAVIAKLYGMNDWALGKHLGIEGKELHTFLRSFDAHFSVDDLLKRVKAQFVATGKVINRYGRPVTIDEPQDNIFVSYYGQSTGVDVTMLGFKQVIDTLAQKAPRVRPVFLLHDAMLLDVHNDDLQHVQAITHVRVRGYVQRFPLKLERLT